MEASTHGRPLPGAPLSAGAEAGGQFWRSGQVGALRLVGHSAPGVPAAHVPRPLPLTARDGALEDEKRTQTKSFRGCMGKNFNNCCLLKRKDNAQGITLHYNAAFYSQPAQTHRNPLPCKTSSLVASANVQQHASQNRACHLFPRLCHALAA